MIQDMYRVMNRISQLQKRFGLVRESRQVKEQQPDGNLFKHHVEKELSKGTGDKGTINELVHRYARQNRVPENLLHSIIKVESGYNPAAVSPKGAMGLMQIMPSVARNMNISDPFSPEQNIKAGSSLLRELLDRYNGDYKKALAAYNAGPVAVDRSQGIPDYPETQNYVKKVMDNYLKNQL